MPRTINTVNNLLYDFQKNKLTVCYSSLSMTYGVTHSDISSDVIDEVPDGYRRVVQVRDEGMTTLTTRLSSVYWTPQWRTGVGYQLSILPDFQTRGTEFSSMEILGKYMVSGGHT